MSSPIARRKPGVVRHRHPSYALVAALTAVCRYGAAMNKKLMLVLAASLLAGTTAISACKKETIGGKIDDALDNRPAEKVQDKVEDMKDKVKDATN